MYFKSILKINSQAREISNFRTKRNEKISKIVSLSYLDKIIIIFVIIIISIIISKYIFLEVKGEEDKPKNLLLKNLTIKIIFENDNKKEIYNLNISCINQSYSIKYNVVETVFAIYIFDENKTLIKPFELALYYKLYIFCNIKSVKKNYSIESESLPNFHKNNNLICIEHFNISEKVELGLKIYQKNHDYKLIYNNFYFNYTGNYQFYLKNKNDNKFSPFILHNQYINLKKEINEKNLTLKASFVKQPSSVTKISEENKDNEWIFKNIYNYYFCFCKGIYCQKEKKTMKYQYCKYYYYLTIIDKNRFLFKKTDYLLADFISSRYNADDTFPIFKQMIKQNMPAHYMTMKNDIYKDYCNDNITCSIIIKEEMINGDFLEKYLYLLLKLKISIAGAIFPAINNIFTIIEYITCINIGHGVKFFKSFLYNDYTSPKRYNKLVLAPSLKLISIAKKYGWKEENIIKICLPKWDKYNIFIDNIIYNEKSIFIFFTFRERKKKDMNKIKKKMEISKLYINNIINLINILIL